MIAAESLVNEFLFRTYDVGGGGGVVVTFSSGIIERDGLHGQVNCSVFQKSVAPRCILSRGSMNPTKVGGQRLWGMMQG